MLIQLPLPCFILIIYNPWPHLVTQHVLVSTIGKHMHQPQAGTLTCLRRSLWSVQGWSWKFCCRCPP